MEENRSILDLTENELREALNRLGQPAYRTMQVWEGLYKNLWQQSLEFTSLPNLLRETLNATYRFMPLTPNRRLISKDRQTNKVLFDLVDGHSIEAVLMNYENRRTVCISSQVGCAMNCSFCATGQMGFRRNLAVGEIIAQVLFFAHELKQQGETLSNVVVMGMGEPFQNYEMVLGAVDRLNDPRGFNLGARRFTISTVGLPDQIRHFADEKRQVNLAVSLHASDNTLRDQLVPINRKYPLEAVLDACRYYFDQTSRRLTFEWALISGINDSPSQATQLVKLTHGLSCHVNIIPLNPTTRYPGQPSAREYAQSFKAILEQHGIPCTIRLRRGVEIQAGCGQLASRQT